MFGRKKKKALEERIKDLEEKVKYLVFAFSEQKKEETKDSEGELATRQIIDEWFNGGKK